MNTLTYACGLGLLLSSPSPQGEAQLLFAPAEESEVVRTFTESTSFSLDSMTQLVAGQEMQQDLPDISGSNSRHTMVTDRYLGIADGRPTRLKRAFEEVSGSSSMKLQFDEQTEAYEYETVSPLKGTEALFAWDSAQSTYTVTDPEGQPRDEFDGLSEDMDLRGLLPTEEVERFGTWEIEPQAFVDAFSAGGDKLLAPAEMPEGDYLALSPLQLMCASLVSLGELQTATGEVSATWDETEKQEDSNLALITIEYSLEGESTATDRVLFLLDEVDADTAEEDLDVTIEARLEGECQLTWNLDQQRVESFMLESAIEETILISWNQSMGANSVEIEVEVVLTGDTTFEVATE